MFGCEPRVMTTDPRPTMFTAVELMGSVLEAVTAADLHRPTPCDDWDVEQLFGHVIGGTRRVAHVARGGAPGDIPSVIEETPTLELFRAGVAGMRETWAVDEILARMLQHPAGVMPGAAAAAIYAQEFTAHAGDLAEALGRTELLDEELAETVLGMSRGVMPPQRPAEFPFGNPVEVPDDAPAHQRLAAWLGRGPFVAA
jgi:uncharacterized protein (TIGR03086 family)